MKILTRRLTTLLILTAVITTPIHSSPTKIETGATATSPFGRSLTGDVITPQQHLGKVIVVLYYTSWCGYCRKAMPDFMQFQKTAETAGLQVLFINHKEDKKLFHDHVQWAKNSSVLMAHDKNGHYGDAYNLESYPHILVIDREGKLVVINKGYGDQSKSYYAKMLSKLLEVSPEQDHTQTAVSIESTQIQARTRKPTSDLTVDREIDIPKVETPILRLEH